MEGVSHTTSHNSKEGAEGSMRAGVFIGGAKKCSATSMLHIIWTDCFLCLCLTKAKQVITMYIFVHAQHTVLLRHVHTHVLVPSYIKC